MENVEDATPSPWEYAGTVPDDAKSIAYREWQRLTKDLEKTRDEVRLLQHREWVIQSQVDAWATILSIDEANAEDGEESPSALLQPRPPFANRRDSVEAVVELLAETGQPMHYQQIYETLTERGMAIGGKRPSNTLLSRFYNDPRLERVGQGTYTVRRTEDR